MGVLDPGLRSRDRRAGDRTLGLSTPPPKQAEAGYAQDAGPRPALPLRPSGRSRLQGRSRRAPPPRRHLVVFLHSSSASSPHPTPATWRAAAEETAPAQLPARPVPAGCGPQTRGCPLVARRGAVATPCLLRHFLRGARHVHTPPPSCWCAVCEGETDRVRRGTASLSEPAAGERPLQQRSALGLNTLTCAALLPTAAGPGFSDLHVSR